MEKKFKVLRTVGTIWKILAWVVLVAGLISAVLAFLSAILGGGVMSQMAEAQGLAWLPGIVGGLILFLFAVLVSLLYFLSLYAVGELIHLLLAIEENTRFSARFIQYLQRQAVDLPAGADALTEASA